MSHSRAGTANRGEHYTSQACRLVGDTRARGVATSNDDDVIVEQRRLINGGVIKDKQTQYVALASTFLPRQVDSSNWPIGSH